MGIADSQFGNIWQINWDKYSDCNGTKASETLAIALEG